MRMMRGLFAAMLYGAAALGATPAAAELDAAEIAALKASRTGDMEKLIIHDAPRPRLETAFETGSGEARTLADWEGKVVLLNFWATWCPPCRKEMPSLDRLQAEMGGEGFEVVALSMDRASTERIEAFYAEVPQAESAPWRVSNLAVYREPTMRIGAEGGILGLPVTLVLDRRGREVARLQGEAEWDSERAKAMLKAIIEALDSPAS
ncbi:MAG: TlpA disulfide reductase family protein [Pikeienuella sp.]|uniref:TlpA disulfide reductase family protein n=1 Tax=Pikeienuella sp. TaxID=2831957 RepID=UPI0039193FE8